jgi:pSer/pThr/pTyr-binding forkhead associated (FHA) protein
MPDLVFVETKPMTGRVVPVRTGTTIGREGTDVLLPDPEVSRRHAHVCALGELPAIQDLGSTNGTWVNEQRADDPVAIAEGDVVRFGHTIWHVRSPGAATRVADADAAEME